MSRCYRNWYMNYSFFLNHEFIDIFFFFLMQTKWNNFFSLCFVSTFEKINRNNRMKNSKEKRILNHKSKHLTEWKMWNHMTKPKKMLMLCREKKYFPTSWMQARNRDPLSHPIQVPHLRLQQHQPSFLYPFSFLCVPGIRFELIGLLV